MNYPTNLEEKTLIVKMAISPLQWGECPGNLRFTIYTKSAAAPMGSISIGGMAAYKLQKLIQANGPQEATVLRGNLTNQFVLTHLTTEAGQTPWKDAVFAKTPVVKKTIVEKTIELPLERTTSASRTVMSATRGNATVSASRTNVAELVEIDA